VVFAMLIVGASSARAQTATVGPYYATPSWDQTFTCATAATCTRFVVLANFSSEAVLDRETGLVWQRTPGSVLVPWAAAVNDCIEDLIGGRLGWRAPTIHELGSLADNTGTLPAGHPFLGVTTGPLTPIYWSTTTLPNQPQFAFARGFPGAPTTSLSTSDKQVQPNFEWCVRGGTGVDSHTE
jgi:hypothetical protein